jgi:hypothetical protein
MLKLTTLALAATLTAGAAQAITLTFDERNFAGGDIVTSFSKGGISGTVTATGGSGQAMIFDSRVLSGEDADLVAPFYKRFDANGIPNTIRGVSHPKNLLIISEDGDQSDPDDNADGGTITFVFDQLVDFASFRVFDDVDNFVVRSDKDHRSAPITLDYNNQWAKVNTGFIGVKSLTFDFGSASGAIDNLKLTPSIVPVPAALPLLLAGVGALGFAGRRKRSKSA